MKQYLFFLLLFASLKVNSQTKNDTVIQASIYHGDGYNKLITPPITSPISILQGICHYYHLDLKVIGKCKQFSCPIQVAIQLTNFIEDLKTFNVILEKNRNNRFYYKLEGSTLVVSFDSSFTAQVEIKKRGDSYFIQTSADGAMVKDILKRICEHYGYQLETKGDKDCYVIIGCMALTENIDKTLGICESDFNTVAHLDLLFNYKIDGKTVKASLN